MLTQALLLIDRVTHGQVISVKAAQSHRLDSSTGAARRSARITPDLRLTGHGKCLY